MRLFPEVKRAPRRPHDVILRTAGFAVGLAAVTLTATPSFAQYSSYVSPYGTPGATFNRPMYGIQQPANNQQSGPTNQEIMQELQRLQQQQQQSQAQAQPSDTAPPQADTGDVNDPNSAAYKANHLADQAAAQRQEYAMASQMVLQDKTLPDTQANPPPDMTELQDINTYHGGTNGFGDDPVSAQASLDMRRQAQKEAALSYGARGGLAKRNFEIMEEMHGFSKALDHVFDFRSLLIRAPSGLLIEPPIISESDKALLINGSGNEAAVADRVFDINEQAHIVTAPRDWREYLIQSWSENVPPPPQVLWPKTPAEQAAWNAWVQEGWNAGVKQADQIFQDNVNRLVSDFDGEVRYRVLLAQNMITAPYAMQEDRGVTGGPNQMKIGDSAIKITDPSQFLKKANLWKPADQ